MDFSTTKEHRSWLQTQSKAPEGFRFSRCFFGFTAKENGKPAKMTLSLILLDEPTTSFGGVFTKNAFPGAPITIGRDKLQEQTLSAILVNNKISNVCAPNGVEDALRVCSALKEQLGIESVIPSSTGIIGWRIPVEEMIEALPSLTANLQSGSVYDLAEGIMTTDLYPKVRRRDLPDGCIVGVAKGAGMVEPNMATMLSYLMTDIDVAKETLQQILQEAVGESFNAISIDSDQSTSDTALALSSQKKPLTDIEAFRTAFFEVCRELAIDLVRNGEGVKHVLEVSVKGAPDKNAARTIGKSVINSPLLQTAICGNDPNVGRIVMAIGKAIGNEDIAIDTNKTNILIAGECVFSSGAFHISPEIEKKLSDYLKDCELYQSQPANEKGAILPPIDYPPHEKLVELEIDLGSGNYSQTVWGCDRTQEYISINADYRS